MKPWTLARVLALTAVMAAAACGDDDDDGGGSAGSSGQATSGSSGDGPLAGKAGMSGGGSGQAGGAAAGSAGSGDGGSSANGGAESAGGQAPSGGSSAQAGAPGAGGDGELVDCNPTHVTCRASPPQCPQGQVPTVDGTCWGECVKIEQCACSEAADCPNNDEYTCWRQQHCGYYVR